MEDHDTQEMEAKSVMLRALRSLDSTHVAEIVHALGQLAFELKGEQQARQLQKAWDGLREREKLTETFEFLLREAEGTRKTG